MADLDKVTDRSIWGGGINSVADPATLSPTQCRQLGNARLTTYGSATRRGGTRQINSAAVSTSSTGNVGIYWPSFQKICAVAGSTQTLFTATAPTSFSSTWNVTMSAIGAFKALSLALFTDGVAAEVLYGQSQAGGLYKYDGTTITSVTTGSPVAVNGICVYNDRLWGWNASTSVTTQSPYSVFASAPLLGDTFGVLGSGGVQIVVQTYGDEPIILCLVVGASLMIFHRTGISRLTGYGISDLSVTPQNGTADLTICGQYAGCAYHNAAWIATPQGLYQVTEGQAVPIGTPTAPDPTIAAIAACASPHLVTVTASPQTFEIWVQVPGAGVYAYHILLGAWSGPFDGAIFASANPSVPFVVKEVGQSIQQQVVSPPDTNGRMWLLDDPSQFTDSAHTDGTSGTAYAMTLQARRMFGQDTFGQLSNRNLSKAWRWANITAIFGAAATTPTVVSNANYSAPNTTTSNVALTVNQQVYYVPIGGVGPWVDVTITDSNTTQSEYLSVEVEGTALGQR